MSKELPFPKVDYSVVFMTRPQFEKPSLTASRRESRQSAELSNPRRHAKLDQFGQHLGTPIIKYAADSRQRKKQAEGINLRLHVICLSAAFGTLRLTQASEAHQHRLATSGLEFANDFAAAPGRDRGQRLCRNVFTEETNRSVAHEDLTAPCVERVHFTVVRTVHGVWGSSCG